VAGPFGHAGDELVADLKRRIPAIFALIRGLAGGRAPDRGRIATYCQPLGERLTALAMAYDKFGGHERASTSLHALFRAQLGDALPQGKVEIGGVDYDLLPDAVLPMALVIYELVSTALSTGALAFEGQVSIGLQRIDGGLTLSWREQGSTIRRGDAPATRGASLRLVKRIISNDLNGLSDVVYLPDGLEAKLWLPERHLAI
jgi:two-component sensor histidine kinase